MKHNTSFRSLVLAGSCLFSLTCKDSSTEPELSADMNLPITTNVPNSFTYALHARQYSESTSHTLNFTSDSLVITLTAFAYAGGLARFEVLDSFNRTVFLDTVKSNKTTVLAHHKTTVPKSCSIQISEFTAELTFVVVGEK